MLETTRLLSLCAGLVFSLAACEESNAPPADEAQSGFPHTDDAGYYFSTNRSGNYELARLEEGSLAYLTSDAAYDSWWPRQSPDGEEMLFYRSRVIDRPNSGGHNNNYEHASLWSLNLRSLEMHELIPKGANGWEAQGVVDWSPDASSLIMAAIDGESGRWHLFSTSSDGSGPRQLSTRTSLYLDPSWSPDGSQIVFVAFPPDYNGTDLSRLEVYLADADGLNEQRLTNDNLRDHDPYWSPDGSRIAFETAVNPAFLGVGQWALRLVDPATSIVSTVLDDGNINTLPRWSKDGERILFHRFEFGSDHGFTLASVHVDGTALSAITLGGNYDDTDLDWIRVRSTLGNGASGPL